MFNHDWLIRESAMLTAIDNVVRQALPERRGWILLDAEHQQQTVVHGRPYLSSPGLPPRFRVDQTRQGAGLGQLRKDASPESRYVVVVARGDAQLAEGVADLCDALSRMNVKWVSVWTVAGGALATVDDEGFVIPPPQLRQEPAIPLPFVFEEELSGKFSVPFSIAVESHEATALLHIAIDGPADSFETSAYEFSFRAVPPATPLGAGRLVFDVDLAPDASDVLVVSPADFRGSVETLPVAISVDGPVSRLRAHLHVIVDRTTLDVESFSSGLLLESNLSDDDFRPNKEPLPHWDQWNLRSRTALANALTEIVPKLQPPTQLSLWWFADVQRDGIAASRIKPPAEPFGPWGECDVEHVPVILRGAPFSYKPGLDVFDAVDEALSAVAAGIGERLQQRSERHAVIIVGDSPPPPRDEADVFWSALVDGSVRTSSRRSPLFHDALESLGKSNVPVGWLYLRYAAPPAFEDSGAAGIFELAQAASVRTYDALRKVPRLTVEPAEGADKVTEALRRLLDHMSAAPRQPRFQLRDGVTA